MLTSVMQLSDRAELEVIPKPELCSFTVRQFDSPGPLDSWHFHPECELTYIYQGRGKRFVGDNISPFGPGDLVLLGTKLPHCWHTNLATRGERSSAYSVVIHFKPDLIGTEFLSAPEMAAVRRLLVRARRGVQFTGKLCGPVSETMAGLVTRTGLETLIDLLNIFAMLVRAPESEVLASAGFSPEVDEVASQRVSEACRHIREHFASPLDYEQIARQAGMSQSGFCHYFRRVTGLTLSEYVNQVRVGHASKLLIDTGQRISEIAYASGYETLSNFNRRFHDLTGLNPREYRNQYQSCLRLSQPSAGPRASLI